jgi:hypothetical protein
VIEKTERELVGVRNDYEKMVREKDLAIETLTHKVNTMCVQYETLFHVSEVFLRGLIATVMCTSYHADQMY